MSYFPTKEDVLFGGSAGAGDLLLETLVGRPADETTWVAMRRALDPLVERYNTGDERMRRLTRLMVETPALAARHREKNARWYRSLRPEVARRLGVDPEDKSAPAPDAVIAAALGCVEAALVAWSSNGQGRPLADLLDQAMGAVG